MSKVTQEQIARWAEELEGRAPGEILAAGVDAFLQKPVDFSRQ